MDETSTAVIHVDLSREWFDNPAIPEMVTWWFDLGKLRTWTKRSDINDAEEAELNKPRTFTVNPFWVLTSA